jgi:hypothetical protein
VADTVAFMSVLLLTVCCIFFSLNLIDNKTG